MNFSYLVDGEPFQLKRGEQRKHESNHPLVVQFDRGNGSATASKLVTDKVPLYVALDPNTRQWNLYPEPNDAGTEAPQMMTLAFPKVQDLIDRPQSVLFEFDTRQTAPPAVQGDLLKALQSAQ